MNSIADIIKANSIAAPVEKKKRGASGKRAILTEEIYAIYLSDTQRTHRKRENWKRYILFLKARQQKDSKEMQALFKKTKSYVDGQDMSFIKEHNLRSFCYFLSIIKTDDLPFIASMARSMEHRGENFSSYIMGHLTGSQKFLTKKEF